MKACPEPYIYIYIYVYVCISVAGPSSKSHSRQPPGSSDAAAAPHRALRLVSCRTLPELSGVLCLGGFKGSPKRETTNSEGVQP